MTTSTTTRLALRAFGAATRGEIPLASTSFATRGGVATTTKTATITTTVTRMSDYHTCIVARPTAARTRESSHASSSWTPFSSLFDRARVSWTSMSAVLTHPKHGVGRARTYSQKSKKTKKAAVVVDAEEDADDEEASDEDDDDGAVQYDPKLWEECVNFSFDFPSSRSSFVVLFAHVD